MQRELENLKVNDLVELLAQKIQTLSHLRENATYGREYDDCKKMIEEIQDAIDEKKVVSIDDRRAISGSPDA